MLTGGFIDINGRNRGLMVAGRGLFEYEVKPTPAGTIALTLMKATGNIDDESAAVRDFDYALIPHTGDWKEAFRTAWEFCAAFRTFPHMNSVIREAAFQASASQIWSQLRCLSPLSSAVKTAKR